jgi:hypothetical protein
MATSRFTFLLFGALTATGVIADANVLPYFILDTDAVSLDASIIAVNPDPSETAHSVVTLAVDCPKTASPDNDACREEGIYPAQIYHTQGSVFGGTVTASADDSTTTWVCALGGCAGCGTQAPDLSAECTKTVVAKGNKRVELTSLDGCYILAHSVPLVVTAGAEKLNAAYFEEGPAKTFVDQYSSWYEQMGCPSATTSTATTTSVSTGSPSTGASVSNSEPSKTSSPTESASPSESSKGNSSARNGGLAVFTGLAAVALSVLAML